MKKFFKEFKDFITRGNVLDMAVGIIVGGAFTAIITALTGQILQPLINWMLSGTDGGLDSAVTMLKPVYDEVTGAIDMSKSIYIDWGAFITAIINFLLGAFVLICIIKAINPDKAKGEKMKEALKEKAQKEDAEKAAEAAEAAEAAAAEAAPEAPAVAAVTTEELLAEIRDLLKAQTKEEEK